MNSLLVKSLTCAALIGGCSLLGVNAASAADLRGAPGNPASSPADTLERGTVVVAPELNTTVTVNKKPATQTTTLSADALSRAGIVSPGSSPVTGSSPAVAVTACVLSSCDLDPALFDGTGGTDGLEATACILSDCTTPPVTAADPSTAPVTFSAPNDQTETLATTGGVAADSTGTLALTGARALPLLVGGLLILLVGSGMLALSRRRRAQESPLTRTGFSVVGSAPYLARTSSTALWPHFADKD